MRPTPTSYLCRGYSWGTMDVDVTTNGNTVTPEAGEQQLGTQGRRTDL